jgi:hypothetical protein
MVGLSYLIDELTTIIFWALLIDVLPSRHIKSHYAQAVLDPI